jgi:hypothetical protein
MNNYDKYLESELKKYKEFSIKTGLFENFFITFEDIMYIHVNERFKRMMLPNLVYTYKLMVKEDSFLETLNPHQLTNLMFI